MLQKVEVSVANHINSNMNNNTTNVNKNQGNDSNNEDNNESTTNKSGHDDSSDNPSVIENIYSINNTGSCVIDRGCTVKLVSKKTRQCQALRVLAWIAKAQKASEEEMTSASESVSATILPWGIAKAQKAAEDEVTSASESVSATSLPWGIAKAQKAAEDKVTSASESVSVNRLPLGTRGDIASRLGRKKRPSQPTSPTDDDGEPLSQIRREESKKSVQPKWRKRGFTAERLPLDSMGMASSSQQLLEEALLSPPPSFCIFCGQDVNNNNLNSNNLCHHLAKFHRSQCFRCAVCEELGGHHEAACFTSSSEAETHAQEQHQIYGLELDNVILPPLSLFLLTCHFCVLRPRHFLGGPLAALQSQLVLHLARHEEIHFGRQHIIDRKVGLCFQVYKSYFPSPLYKCNISQIIRL